MSVATTAKTHCKKAMKFTLSLFSPTFNSSKCKTAAKLAVARIKLLKNKRQVVVRQMRRDIAMLLESGQDATARIRVEHVMREQNILAANEFIELFCELIVQRLSIIAKQRECPTDLKEGISSLIFAAPRCSEIPELLALRDIFQKKYGREFVGAATDLRPSCGVNRQLIDKLSVRTPAGEVKLKLLKEIAKEYQVEWDTTESEAELLKPPEELIEGPRTFVSATSLPVKSTTNQYVQPDYIPTRYSDHEEMNTLHFEDTKSAASAAAESAKQAIAAAEAAAYLAGKDSSNQNAQAYGFNNGVNGSSGKFVKRQSSDRSDKRLPVNTDTQKFHRRHNYNVPPARLDVNSDNSDSDEEDDESYDHTSGPTRPPKQTRGKLVKRQSSGRSDPYNVPPARSDENFDESDGYEDDDPCDRTSGPTRPPPKHTSDIDARKMYRRNSYNAPPARSDVNFDESDGDEGDDSYDHTCGPTRPPKQTSEIDARKMCRRHSYNAPPAHSDIRFDESDCDEEIEMEQPPSKGMNHPPPPPNRPAPQVPSAHARQGHRIHPKLPDYEALAARFEALKLRKSQP